MFRHIHFSSFSDETQEPPAVLDKTELRGEWSLRAKHLVWHGGGPLFSADLGKTANNFILDLVAFVNWKLGGKRRSGLCMKRRGQLTGRHDDNWQARIRRHNQTGHKGLTTVWGGHVP